jgi:hypothetical protein
VAEVLASGDAPAGFFVHRRSWRMIGRDGTWRATVANPARANADPAADRA